MTDSLSVLPEPTSDDTVSNVPTTPKRRGRVAVPATLAVLLVAAVAYGAVQHGHATKADTQRVATEHTLADVRKTWHTTRDQLATTQSSLDDARTTVASDRERLAVCKKVAKATDQLFDASVSLNDTLIAVLDQNFDTSGMDDASGNLDTVQSLIDSGGWADLDTMLTACTTGDTGTGI